jgi:putative Ca2+/H+ antiporter (TMEM165/GDT1 family)
LIAQAFLIRGSRQRWHRRLGTLGWMLGPAVSVSILVLNHHHSQAREITAFRLWLFTSNIGDATLFFACWLMAMRTRHTPVVHARYMVCTAITFIPPIFDRLFSRYTMTPGIASIMPAVGGQPFTILPSFAMVFVALGTLAWFDVRSPRRVTVFARMFVVFAVWYAAPLVLMTSDGWRALIVWYLSMPLS